MAMMGRFFHQAWWIWGLLAGLFWGQWVWANSPQQMQPPCCVTVEGVALIEDDNINYARHLAIKDALTNASYASGLNIKSQAKTENFQLTHQSASYKSQAKVSKYQITDEYEEDGLFHVVIQAWLSYEPQACPGQGDANYQVPLLVAQPVVEQPQQLNDIAGFVVGYQQEILRRLTQVGYSNLQDVRLGDDIQPVLMIQPQLNAGALKTLRDSTGAQYLLLNVLRSAAIDERVTATDEVQRYFGFANDPTVFGRNLAIDWYLLDLYDNNIAASNRVELSGRDGDYRVGRNKPFGTGAFFATDTGKLFDQLLRTSLSQVQDFLKCQPLVTEIIQKQGDNWLIMANSQSQIAVGNELTVYGAEEADVVVAGRNLGALRKAKGFLRVIQVTPRFAVTEVIAEQTPFALGDRVVSE